MVVFNYSSNQINKYMKKFTSLIAMQMNLQMKLSMLIVSFLLLSQMAIANLGDKAAGHSNIIKKTIVDTTIKGRVVTDKGPLAGVTVSVDGTTNATVTDEAG